MKKVYIVTDGEYSDYHIEAVFSTSEKAEEASQRYGGSVEEWNLDAPTPRPGWDIYFVRMAKDGTVDEIEKTHDWFHIQEWAHPDEQIEFDCKDNLIASVLAKDEKHAVKIMNERRTATLKLGRWGRKK